ncbi:hypothetical protein C2S53_007073 [Perilla frutescens var. hirtella]|uniref:Uncharacterized protein n=1 Tax=Perilla frutescens var. hirtella TaxID=608512 RepID=A0AAD4INL6_PERFH|nr:hypothetical protein C2S53_007073 [Perilla frutescens var. hirtella]
MIHVSCSLYAQAIVALKKGAHLLKYGRRGKPKFCPFRLSMDEKFLLWYSGSEEKKLRLSKVTNIIHGQNTKELQLEKESQCLSLIYENGKSSLELICKDEMQAESWFIGLRAIISRNYCNGTGNSLKKQRGAQSCINSPAAFMRRKHILGLSEKKRTSEVHSSCGSPPSSFSPRCTSDGMSCSSDSFYSASSLSNMRNAVNILAPSSPLIQQDDNNNRAARASTTEAHFPHSSRPKMHILKDVYIWGEGAAGGYLGGSEAHANALLPKLLESATMLDVRSISLGKKHAAIATKEGEVFCWGEGQRGRLGHKVDMDTLRPKIVDSLTGVHVIGISCSTYQTRALTLSGELYTWGDNYTPNLLGEDRKRSHWLPHRLSGSLDGITISNVSCSEWHTALVSVCGRLFSYGDGTFGALGHGNLQSYSHPKEVESIKGLRVKTVACGPWHTAAVIEITVDCAKSNDTGGKLFTWGDSDKGRLGHPDQERKLLPTYVAQLFDHDFVQVSCGDTLTAGLTSTGRVFTIGSAVYGQLGIPQARDKSIVAVKGRLIDEFVVEISSGSFHVAVLTSRGNVYTWGRGENGQLGLGDTKDRNSPNLVDSLKGTKVEKITCGSSSTAAICAHKSLSTADQLACRGCGNTFGFTRKKQNCYNCGRLFCRACSSNRSIYASLAPNEKKPFRVCNECFNELQSVSSRVVISKLETNTPRPSPMTREVNSNGADAMEDPCPTHTRTKSIIKSSYDGDRSSERRDVTFQGEKSPTPDLIHMDKALPRWGHVSCPQTFMNDYRDPMTGRTHALGHEFSSECSVCLQVSILEEKLTTAAPQGGETDLDRSGKYLSEEILKLKAQADNLQELCETREERIQENKRKIAEAQSLTEEEAANFKEANGIIQMLTSKLCEMSEKISGKQEAEDKAGFRSPQTRKLPVLALARTPKKVIQLEDSSVENLCSSPIVFSSKLRSLYGGDLHSGIRRMDSTKTGIKCSKVEWVEQYQAGVFITFTSLPDGQTGLRRIRFSRRNFNEREAKRWWEENQQTVCRNHGIDGYSIPNS